MVHHRFIAFFVVVALAFGALSGCGLTPGYTYHSAEAAREQRAADELRRGGANEVARSAQDRADDHQKKAMRKCDGFVECVVDLLFYSWLGD